MVCSIWARRRSAAAISSAEGGSGSAVSMRSISPSTSIHSRARSRATRSGSPMPRLVVERRQRLAQLPAVDQRRLDAGDELGPLVEDVVTDAGPRRGGLLDAAHRVVGLGVGLLGVAQGVAGVLELAAQRGLVELGRLEVAELAGRVVDHLAGGVALLLDEDELAPRRLDVGAAGVEGAPCLLGRVGELAGPFEQAVAVLEVGVHAPGPGGGLVSAVGGDGLQLAGPPQAGGQLAADALVVFDPADRGLAAGSFEGVGPERDARRRRGVALGAGHEARQLLGQRGAVAQACREDGQPPVQARQLARSAHVRRRGIGGAGCAHRRGPPQSADRIVVRSPRIGWSRQLRYKQSRAFVHQRAHRTHTVGGAPPRSAGSAGP